MKTKTFNTPAYKQVKYKFNQADGVPAEVKATTKKEAIQKLENWLGIKINAKDVYKNNKKGGAA